MGSFKQAIKWMKEGKKVTRPHFDNDNYWMLVDSQYASGNDKCISSKGKMHVCPSISCYEASDWEIFKEEDDWNLVDCDSVDYPDLRRLSDVRIFIQKVKEDMLDITFKINAKNKDLELHEVNDILLDIESILKKRAGEL